MSLDKIILENERLGKARNNQKLIEIKLKELVNKHPQQVADLLTLLGIKASVLAPKAVLYSTLVKYIPKNSELRATIARVILENSGYASADGQGMAIAGGALQALGGILSGIGRNKTINSTTPLSPEQLQRREEARKKQQEEDDKKKKTNMAIGIGVGVVALILIIIGINYAIKKNKAKELAATAGSPKVAKPSLDKLNAS